MKAIYITIKQAFTLSAWQFVATMYNRIDLECSNTTDAKYYTVVIFIVLMAIHPAFIIPAVAIFSSIDRADRKKLGKNNKSNNHGHSKQQTYRGNK